MTMRVLCVLLLATLVLADEVNTKENAEINNAASCDKSLYSKGDLKDIIDYVANSLSVDVKLNDAIQAEAVPVLNKHVQRIKSTLDFYSNRPEHLKHVLEDVSVTRQQVEQYVTKLKKNLEKYSEFSEIYQEKSERAKAIHKKLLSYNQLCQLNCGTAEVEFRSAVSDSPSDKYCGSISEIHKTIQDRLQKVLEENLKKINQEVIKADKDYNEKVRIALDDLKNIALKEFGHTMYDILNLQDQYHHLKKDLKIFNNDYWLVALRSLNIQLDALLMKFENVVDYFAAYCQNCNKIRSKREAVEERQKVDAFAETNLLDSLINYKIIEINEKSDEALYATFNNLNESLNKTAMQNFFIENLKPIQIEVKDLTKKEIEAFQELNISSLNIDMELVKKLIANTKDLMDAIAKEYLAIVAIIRDLVPKYE